MYGSDVWMPNANQEACRLYGVRDAALHFPSTFPVLCAHMNCTDAVHRRLHAGPIMLRVWSSYWMCRLRNNEIRLHIVKRAYCHVIYIFNEVGVWTMIIEPFRGADAVFVRASDVHVYEHHIFRLLSSPQHYKTVSATVIIGCILYHVWTSAAEL